MSSRAQYFLLVLNHQKGNLGEVVKFGDAGEAAVDAYLWTESPQGHTMAMVDVPTK